MSSLLSAVAFERKRIAVVVDGHLEPVVIHAAGIGCRDGGHRVARYKSEPLVVVDIDTTGDAVAPLITGRVALVAVDIAENAGLFTGFGRPLSGRTGRYQLGIIWDGKKEGGKK